jgi:hypothetical protein
MVLLSWKAADFEEKIPSFDFVSCSCAMYCYCFEGCGNNENKVVRPATPLDAGL